MLRILTISIMLLASVSVSLSQSYYYLFSRGVGAEFDMSAQNKQVIMSGPVNDKLSSAQKLPFAWNFYGKQVEYYKISDNGYITFDTSTTVSIPMKTTLPSQSAPMNSIFAYWYDFELSNNVVTNTIKAYTLGKAPDRVHVVQWYVAPKGYQPNSNYLFFALRIWEKGTFDILFQQKLLYNTTVGGTSGCQNDDATLGTMLEGSPNFQYTGGVYVKENVPVYTFYYGIQPDNDIQFVNLDLPEIAKVNVPVKIAGKFLNHGKTPVNSVTVEYQVGNNPVQTSDITFSNISSNKEFNFEHPVEFTPTKLGNFEIVRAWISKVNSVVPSNINDDSSTFSIFVNNGFNAGKKVFIEEFSTCPCGFCPEGHLFLERLMDTVPEVIGIIHHSGFGTDSMTIPESIVIANAFTSGAPTAANDRVYYPLTAYKYAINRTEWAPRAMENLKKNAPLSIDMTADWNSTTRELSINIGMNFIDFAIPGNLALNVFIIEDSVSGIGKGWDQTNYYNTTQGHYFYGKGDPMVGYIHRHVIRAAPFGPWGLTGLIPNSVAPDMKITKDLTYTVPDRYKIKDISIIAFVSYNENPRKEILNTEEIKLESLGIIDQSENKNSVFVYPNPAGNEVIFKYGLIEPGYVQITVFNSYGQKVALPFSGFSDTGEHSILFNASGLSQGIYHYKFVNGEKVASGSFVIIK